MNDRERIQHGVKAVGAGSSRPWVRPLGVLAGLACAVALSFTLGNRHQPGKSEAAPQKTETGAAHEQEPTKVEHDGSTPEIKNPHGTPAESGEEKPIEPPKDGLRGFLEGFGKTEPATAEGAGSAAPANDKLEKQFEELAKTVERLEELRQLVRSNPAITTTKEFTEMKAEQTRLVNHLNKDLASFEKLVGQARKARPQDPVPQWLTGELLIQIGGEPAEILPYLQRAVAGGLDRPRVLSSLSRAQVEANQLQQAYQSALKALQQDAKDHYTWKAFTQAGFNLEKFDEIIERLNKAFPSERPEWATAMLRQAKELQPKVEAELKLRKAEKKDDNFPRVRLFIEHRRFVRDPGGTKASKIESTGKGEVVIELFEDQAPATVANFLSLVEKGFYDGTRFHMAESASVVAGGDPKSRNADPADDGTGGPGYVIPDEFATPQARGHFRGSVSMVNMGPHTAGSQFFVTLVPKPEMNGHFTVFGRVVQGQDVVDRITLGRTTPLIGHFGKVVPGDLIVRAEVVRKRPHDYRVIKEQPQ